MLEIVKKTLIRGPVREFLLPRLRPRPFHAYCVGAMKTGTHSLANLFKESHRANHEPERGQTIRTTLAWQRGEMSDDDVRDYLIKRDRRLWLAMDSSVFNYPFLAMLGESFPDAKFVLTIRECASWVDSCFNHQLSLPIDDDMQALLDYWFRPSEYQPGPFDAPLTAKGLYPLACYLDFWQRYNATVMATIPAERLLVVRTNEIRSEGAQLATFLGMRADELNLERSHSFKAGTKHDVLASLDSAYVADRIAERCGALNQRFFN